ncbi:MAG: hypothetical protein Q9204_005859 [Flavoplaca sp. TL-2023a]
MDVPNEITLRILAYVPRYDMKQTRLVCQTWAILSAEYLFDTIYVSPREIDMAVFDSITQHPVLRRAPRHLVYDSAVFEKLDQKTYASRISQQFRFGTFDILGDARVTIEKLDSLLNTTCEHAGTNNNTAYTDHPVLMEGYRRYAQHANEYCNLFSNNWTKRISQGLRSLGPIVSVVMRNTWQMLYDYLGAELAARGPDHCSPQKKGQHIVHIYDLDVASIIFRKRIKPDGTRLIGSPSARAYPPTALQPTPTQDWAQFQPAIKRQQGFMDKAHVMKTGQASGYFEFVEVVRALTSAGKYPKELKAVGGLGPNVVYTGIAAYVFDSAHSLAATKFLDLADRLTYLQLKLALNSYSADLAPNQWPDIKLLQQFLWRARSLETLSLEYPIDLRPGKFKFYPLFSDEQPWLPTGLTRLELRGFSASYRELATHVFLCLPALQILMMGDFLLEQGSYGNLIEGFRSYTEIRTLTMDHYLYHANGERFLAPSTTVQDEVDQENFLNSIAKYVMTGENAPALDGDDFDDEFDEWLDRMKEEQEELVAAYTGDQQEICWQDLVRFAHSPANLRFVAKAIASYKSAPSMYK